MSRTTHTAKAAADGRLPSASQPAGAPALAGQARLPQQHRSALVAMVAESVSRRSRLRRRKIAALRAKIVSGEYDPQARQIAERIVRGRG
jgi:anti-sigma28 factor (negative regulator of flagellin synthesis)